jgi:hypothetical protein
LVSSRSQLSSLFDGLKGNKSFCSTTVDPLNGPAC